MAILNSQSIRRGCSDPNSRPDESVRVAGLALIAGVPWRLISRDVAFRRTFARSTRRSGSIGSYIVKHLNEAVDAARQRIVASTHHQTASQLQENPLAAIEEPLESKPWPRKNGFWFKQFDLSFLFLRRNTSRECPPSGNSPSRVLFFRCRIRARSGCG